MAAAGQLAPGVLPYQEIRDLCGLASAAEEDECSTGPIRPCLKRNIRTAGYDLRLGEEYYRRADPPPRCETVETSSLAEGESIVIESNQVVVLSTYETLELDRSTIGRLSLKMDLLRQGLIMASQSQIDAGYSGGIFVLLYNLSHRAVSVKRGQSVFRLELIRLPQPTEKPYTGDYRNKVLGEALIEPLASSLDEMRRRVESAEDQVKSAETRVRNTRWGGAVLAVVAIALPLSVPTLFGVSGDIDDLEDRTSRLEGPEQIPAVEIIERQDETIDNLTCRIKKLEAKPKPVKC